MSYRPITLPEPPPIAALAGVPEIFDRGVTTVIRKAVIIGNGVAGAEHQCIGLVKALGLGNSYQLHRVIRPRGGINEYLRWLPLPIHRRIHSVLCRVPWEFTRQQILSLLTGAFRQQRQIAWNGPASQAQPPGVAGPGVSADAFEANAKEIAEMAENELSGEGPLLVVASGRDTVATALEVKRLAPGSTFLVQIQHPHCDVKQFDMVITPAHDYYAYTPQAKKEFPERILQWVRPPPPEKNVVLTVGALHHADAIALRSAAATWHQQLASLPRPMIAVSVGGPQRFCRYGDELAQQLVAVLRQVLSLQGGCARISFSRRTPASIRTLMERELGSHERVYIWDGRGPNPHLGHLAWADCFVATADSVSMLSEACSTGKPVYVFGDERCSWKFRDFIATLKQRGALRTLTSFENLSESWSYPPLRDNAEAAAKVRETLAARGWSI